MAIKGQDSNVNTSGEFQKFTGPVQVLVEAINPSQTELQAMGYKADKVPEYVIEDDKGRKIKIDVYVKGKDNPKFRTKFTLFLEDKELKSSKTGKVAVMNNYCQGAFDNFCYWDMSIEDTLNREGKNGNKYVKPDGARIAKSGEPDLYRFLFNWSNTDNSKEDCVLDNFQAIFKENYKELQGLVKLLGDKFFWGMAIVTEKGYQGLYPKMFGKPLAKEFPNKFAAYVAEQAKGEYPIKDKWSVEFKEYIPVPVFADAEPGSDVTPGSTTEVDF